jgi:hypothetical protein
MVIRGKKEMVNMRYISFLLLALLICIVPVSADHNVNGTVSYEASTSVPYSHGQISMFLRTLHYDRIYHRFDDAKFLSHVVLKDTLERKSGYEYVVNNVVPFTSYIDDIYYGSGTVGVFEQDDGAVWYSVYFDYYNESYALSLTGINRIDLIYDTSVLDNIQISGTPYYQQVSALSASKPTGFGYFSDDEFILSYTSSSSSAYFVGYITMYQNDYVYSYNDSLNICSISSIKDVSSSMWCIYDSNNSIYTEQTGYSLNDVSTNFFRKAGVYLNITFNVFGGTSVITAIDVNGTAVPPDDEDDGDFVYNITTELDEYSPGDTVNVTYTTDQKGTIQVVKTVTGGIFHSIGFVSGATNATWQFYIAENEPYGFYDVFLFDSSNTILDSVRYSLLPTTSSLDILQSSVDLHETFIVFAQTVNESILSIEDPDGVEVWNESIGALMYDYIYYTPTIKTGIYTAYLYDDATLNDTVMVYLADPPIIDDPLDPETNGSIVVEDVLGDDETMTEYYNEKFRDFAPTIWGFFMLMCLLFLMSILTSFNSGGKRR